jgi:hypothetical protein
MCDRAPRDELGGSSGGVRQEGEVTRCRFPPVQPIRHGVTIIAVHLRPFESLRAPMLDYELQE